MQTPKNLFLNQERWVSYNAVEFQELKGLAIWKHCTWMNEWIYERTNWWMLTYRWSILVIHPSCLTFINWMWAAEVSAMILLGPEVIWRMWSVTTACGRVRSPSGVHSLYLGWGGSSFVCLTSLWVNSHKIWLRRIGWPWISMTKRIMN